MYRPRASCPDAARIKNAALWRSPTYLALTKSNGGCMVNTAKDDPQARQPSEGKSFGRSPTVRPAAFDDYDQIAALQVRNGLSARSREDWVALWRGNPAYEPRAKHWPIGWVLENEHGEIVGSVGNVPLIYQFRGRDLRAGCPHGWTVDPQYRGYSLLIFNRFLTQKDVDLFIFSTVGPRAEPVFRALQLSRVPVGQWHKSAFWIVNRRRFSERVISRQSPLLASVMCYPASAALYCWDRLQGVGRRGAKSTVDLELCNDFDPGFDDFWEELTKQNHNVLLAVRTKQTLRWHFRKTAQRPAIWIVGVRDGSRRTAYAVFDRLDSSDGVKRVRLVDFQALRGYEGALTAALRWMLKRCREEGMDILEVTGAWQNRPSLPRIAAPYGRALPCWVYYYKAAANHLSEPLKDPAVWAPTSFDGDASL